MMLHVSSADRDHLFTPLDAEAAQAEAEAAAGIDDPERELYWRNLEVLVKSANEEGRLSASGRTAMHAELVQSIANRLESIKWMTAHPETAQQPVEAPLLLMGLPRSGTTYFHKLFDHDPAIRILRMWESMAPCPPPHANPDSAKARLAAAQETMRVFREIYPDLYAIHLYDPDGPEECHAFLAQTFGAAGYHNIMEVPSYYDFLEDHLDMHAVYRNYRRQLQVLQWKAPRRRWAMKYPNHIIAMPELKDVFPDCRMLVTHRDPRQTLGSICKLTFNFRQARSDVRDQKMVGQQMRHFIRRHLDGLMAYHNSPAGKSVIHVDYYRLVRSPADIMGEVYEALDMEYPASVRDAIAKWHRENPQHKRGTNPYSLRDFGLDPNEIAEAYGDYISAFDIPTEAEGLARSSA
jgi:hypothetical protein